MPDEREAREPDDLAPRPIDPIAADDAAAAAIKRARAAAKAQGKVQAPSSSPRRTHGRVDGETRSGAGPDARDPQSIRKSVQKFIADQGWDESASVAALSARWAEIVGPDIAAHAEIETFDPGEHLLVLRADSHAWATQLRLLSGQFINRIASEIGPDVVRTLKILGPAGPRRTGTLRVRGGGPPKD